MSTCLLVVFRLGVSQKRNGLRRITTACTGDLHCALRAAARQFQSRNAGAVMLQAGRQRASTHEGVEVIAFSCMHFRRRWQLGSYWHAARPTLRPLSPHKIYFRAGPCVLLPSVFCAHL